MNKSVIVSTRFVFVLDEGCLNKGSIFLRSEYEKQTHNISAPFARTFLLSLDWTHSLAVKYETVSGWVFNPDAQAFRNRMPYPSRTFLTVGGLLQWLENITTANIF